MIGRWIKCFSRNLIGYIAPDFFDLSLFSTSAYRSILFCVEVISSTLPLRKQRNTLHFGTIRLKWKTDLITYTYRSKQNVFLFSSGVPGNLLPLPFKFSHPGPYFPVNLDPFQDISIIHETESLSQTYLTNPVIWSLSLRTMIIGVLKQVTHGYPKFIWK